MDIEEAKKITRNKIYSDYLTKNVREVVKEQEWKKQDRIEGLKELFHPIIESQDNIKKSIDNQQNATINLQNATINKQNETIHQLQNNQIDIRELIDRLIKNRRNDDGSDDGSDGSDGSDKFYDANEGDNDTSENQNNRYILRELIDQLIQNRRNDGSDNDGDGNENKNDGEGDGNENKNDGEGDGGEYDIYIRKRLNELLLLDNEFNKNLTDYKSIKILGEHNFFSFPSDFYNYDDINEIEKRKNQVRTLISNYYSKLQDYANFYNENDVYSLAKLKDKFLRSENKDLVKLLQNEINNYNVLSVYFTNLAYVEYYKNNERSGLN